MKIELLYFDDCPSWQKGLENLKQALSQLDIKASVEMTAVETEAAALAQRFQGSPTIRVNGEDLFPTGHESYALGCRVYQTPDGIQGVPTIKMIREALEKRGLPSAAEASTA